MLAKDYNDQLYGIGSNSNNVHARTHTHKDHVCVLEREEEIKDVR